jgi:DNA-binding NarL/FixJ family response regulator
MSANLAPPRPRRLERVLLVDDDPLYAEALGLLLGVELFEIVGVARNGVEGVEMALRLRPDVVLMDVEMPLLDGVEAARRIRGRVRAQRIVLITGSSDPEVLARARSTGAVVLRKSSSISELDDALAGRAPSPHVHAASLAAA